MVEEMKESFLEIPMFIFIMPIFMAMLLLEEMDLLLSSMEILPLQLMVIV